MEVKVIKYGNSFYNKDGTIYKDYESFINDYIEIEKINGIGDIFKDLNQYSAAKIKTNFFKKIISLRIINIGLNAFYKKSEIEKISKGWERVDADTIKVILALRQAFKKWYCIPTDYGFNMFADPEDIKIASELLKVPLKPYVVKDTDYPYWFKLKDTIIPSKTSSWFNFLYEKYTILAPVWLEEYNGKDKYLEHKEK